MRRWKYDGFILGQTVNAHIKEAAYYQTQNGEQEYQKYFHGYLLWTYYGPEVNTCSDEIGDLGTKQSRWKIELTLF
jgi:hypothetical protein